MSIPAPSAGAPSPLSSEAESSLVVVELESLDAAVVLPVPLGCVVVLVDAVSSHRVASQPTGSPRAAAAPGGLRRRPSCHPLRVACRDRAAREAARTVALRGVGPRRR